MNVSSQSSRQSQKRHKSKPFYEDPKPDRIERDPEPVRKGHFDFRLVITKTQLINAIETILRQVQNDGLLVIKENKIYLLASRDRLTQEQAARALSLEQIIEELEV